VKRTPVLLSIDGVAACKSHVFPRFLSYSYMPYI